MELIRRLSSATRFLLKWRPGFLSNGAQSVRGLVQDADLKLGVCKRAVISRYDILKKKTDDAKTSKINLANNKNIISKILKSKQNKLFAIFNLTI